MALTDRLHAFEAVGRLGDAKWPVSRQGPDQLLPSHVGVVAYEQWDSTHGVVLVANLCRGALVIAVVADKDTWPIASVPPKHDNLLTS